jgi:hypothetical protein
MADVAAALIGNTGDKTRPAASTAVQAGGWYKCAVYVVRVLMISPDYFVDGRCEEFLTS